MNGADFARVVSLKEEIRKLAEETYGASILAGVGFPGAVYDLSKILKDFKQPALVQSIDKIGAKLLVAKTMNSLEICGADLVNRCANDILPAKPVIFMDYIAQDKLRKEEILQIVEGMAIACKAANISLVGGKTDQMPGICGRGKIDLAGAITGLVEKNQIIDNRKIKPGDMLIGLPSSGLHTTGYSVVKKIFFNSKDAVPLAERRVKMLGCSLSEALLNPHCNYWGQISSLLNNHLEIRGIAHITTGGLEGSLARVLPDGCQARVRYGSWPIWPIFQLIQEKGSISPQNMLKIFNMGIGMVLVVSYEMSDDVCGILCSTKDFCFLIGEIVKGEKGVVFYS